MSAERLIVLDKYSGERIGEVPVADAGDVDRAVLAARAAFETWRDRPAHERARILRGAADGIERRRDEFTTTIAREAGKAWKHASVEVSRGIETLTFSAEEAKRIHGETVPMDASAAGEGRVGFYFRMPLGVVAAISPFNFPLNLVAHKVGPALAAGNTIVLKPAEETPLTAVLLREILVEAGLPEDVLQLVHGEGPATGEPLVRHPVPAKVSFTGSPPVGRRITEIAGIKRVTLELGNNSGTIVEPDADLAKAIPRCVMSAFANAGQVCLSLQRLYVHEAIADRFTAEFVRQTDAQQVGNPLDRDTDVGPLISDEAADRAEAWIRDAAADGARVLTGGRREGPAGRHLHERHAQGLRGRAAAGHGRRDGQRHVDLPRRSHAVRRQSPERHRPRGRALRRRGDDQPSHGRHPPRLARHGFCSAWAGSVRASSYPCRRRARLVSRRPAVRRLIARPGPRSAALSPCWRSCSSPRRRGRMGASRVEPLTPVSARRRFPESSPASVRSGR
jgi:acyl-CoA reductase-like NAD-dependent aldehyde dehydrogenase